MNLVVYTAVSPGYDTLKSPPAECRDMAQFVAFTSGGERIDGWEYRQLYDGFSDPCRNAKIHKILAHEYFPSAQYSLWLDGTIEIKSGVCLQLLVTSALRNGDFAVYRHRSRDCIYKEAAACIAARKDSESIIKTQTEAYRSAGYPSNSGLAECTVLLRRHTPEVKAFNLAWWAEIVKYSRRDQLSFNFVATRLRFPFLYLDGSISSNSYFVRHKHRHI